MLRLILSETLVDDYGYDKTYPTLSLLSITQEGIVFLVKNVF